MYAFNSVEHHLLRAYAAASAPLHEGKLNQPARATLIANGHLQSKPHLAGGLCYEISPAGKSELASILPPASAPAPADLELQRGIELKKKLADGAITSAEKVELIDIALRRINL